ncbi:MAG TPA: mechanosensitive ion channel family protein [Clostridiales bacterium]|nr:mechanosensitive ion channel family protein [Clostridiales bacterium]
MIKTINDYMISFGLSEGISLHLSNVINAIIIILFGVLIYLITKNIILRILEKIILKSKAKWDDLLLKNKVFERTIHIIPAFVIYAIAPIFPAYQDWIQRIAYCYFVIVLVLVINKLFDAVNDIYNNFEVSRERPIKGFLQVLKIFAFTIGIIVIVAALIDRSPLLLLSGIGAATAVLLLIFQNSILGFVASIQLASNNMLKIGDWIEMPQYGADGDVLEISLHAVKIQNWDKSITTIPTYAFISESFKNWRGMQESGGRRIKRAIYIDTTSIKICDEEMLERYSKIQYIEKYIEDKKKEIMEYNNINDIDTSSIVNGRHLTNIGTFRAYVVNYLKNHPELHKDRTLMVRQLNPTEKGIPIEIYAFTKTTVWINYEAVQSDIFDHILAIVPEFDLRVFQNLTGYDFRKLQ